MPVNHGTLIEFMSVRHTRHTAYFKIIMYEEDLIMKKHVVWALANYALIASTTVYAHSNFVENPVDGSREWLEGSRQFLKLNLAHTCGHGGVSEDIKDVKIVFPNGKDQVVTEWVDARGTQQTPLPAGLNSFMWTFNAYAPTDETAWMGANGVMSIKPSVDWQFKSIEPTKEEVPVYYNHGDNPWDVVAISYKGLGGAIRDGQWGLTNEYYKNIEFVATLPNFKKDSCYSKLVVDIPAADYCAGGSGYVWWKTATAGIPNNLIAAANYVPSITVKRNLTRNPLPASCNGAGKTAEVRPSDATLDRYFADLKTWVSRKQGGKSMPGLVDNHGCVAPKAWHAAMNHCM